MAFVSKEPERTRVGVSNGDGDAVVTVTVFVCTALRANTPDKGNSLDEA